MTAERAREKRRGVSFPRMSAPTLAFHPSFNPFIYSSLRLELIESPLCHRLWTHSRCQCSACRPGMPPPGIQPISRALHHALYIKDVNKAHACYREPFPFCFQLEVQGSWLESMPSPRPSQIACPDRTLWNPRVQIDWQSKREENKGIQVALVPGSQRWYKSHFSGK